MTEKKRLEDMTQEEIDALSDKELVDHPTHMPSNVKDEEM